MAKWPNERRVEEFVEEAAALAEGAEKFEEQLATVVGLIDRTLSNTAPRSAFPPSDERTPETLIAAGTGYCLERVQVLAWLADRLGLNWAVRPIYLVQPESGLEHHIAEVEASDRRACVDLDKATVFVGADGEGISYRDLYHHQDLLRPLVRTFGAAVLEWGVASLYLQQRAEALDPAGATKAGMLLGGLQVSSPGGGKRPTLQDIERCIAYVQDMVRVEEGTAPTTLFPWEPLLQRDEPRAPEELWAALSWVIRTATGARTQLSYRTSTEGAHRWFLETWTLGEQDPNHRRPAYALTPKAVLISPDSEGPRSLKQWGKDAVRLAASERFADLVPHIAATPSALNLQIGDRCNAACTMCWQARRRELGGRHPELPGQAVRELLQAYRQGLQSIEFVSFGEPLIHAEIETMLKAVTDASLPRAADPIAIHMVTNGSRQVPAEVLEAPGDLTFSIDAVDPAIYEKVRRGLKLNGTMINLRLALAYIDRHARRKIGINMVITRRTWMDILPMAGLAAKLNVDYLAYLLGAGMEKTEDPEAAISPTEGDPAWAEVRRSIERAQRLFPKIRDRTVPNLMGRQTEAAKAYPCYIPWSQLAVGPDGIAHPCCRSFDINLGPAQAAWYGPELAELRRQLLTGDIDAQRFPSCSKCPHALPAR